MSPSSLTSLERDYHKLLREQGKGAQFMADLEVAQDIQTVLSRAYDRLTTDELQKVSNLMNSIFLEMIGFRPFTRRHHPECWHN